MSPLLTVEFFYGVTGAVLALVAGRIALDAGHPKRWGSALFWGLLAVVFIFGKILPPVGTGYLLLTMVLLAAAGQVGRSNEATSTKPERVLRAGMLQNRIFWPVLLIPASAIVGSLCLGRIHFGTFELADPKQATLISVGIGMLLALAAGLTVTAAPASRDTPSGLLSSDFLPTIAAWHQSFYAIHEWIGCAWYSLR